MTQPTVDERAALARAVALAASTLPSASPNPTVGCVVLDATGAIAGEGASTPVGGPHAEVVALGRAGARSRGATAVVSLEPCAHHGRTPPCSRALLAAGIARVVVGRADPNPVAHGGAVELAEAGVDVVGPLADGDTIARAIDGELAGTRSMLVRRRPRLTLKLAQRADGGLVAAGGERWITGPAARRAVHRDRARSDAVLVGIGTVLADDPSLDVRGLEVAAAPRAVVLDALARTPPTARLVRPGTLVLVAPDAPAPEQDALRSRGVTVRTVERAAGGLDLVAALGVLADEGVSEVLAEPGPTLAAALLAADVVDRVVLHVAGGGTMHRAPRCALALDGWREVRRGGAGPDRVVELVPPADRLAGRAALAVEAA